KTLSLDVAKLISVRKGPGKLCGEFLLRLHATQTAHHHAERAQDYDQEKDIFEYRLTGLLGAHATFYRDHRGIPKNATQTAAAASTGPSGIFISRFTWSGWTSNPRNICARKSDRAKDWTLRPKSAKRPCKARFPSAQIPPSIIPRIA